MVTGRRTENAEAANTASENTMHARAPTRSVGKRTRARSLSPHTRDTHGNVRMGARTHAHTDEARRTHARQRTKPSARVAVAVARANCLRPPCLVDT